MDNLKIVTAKYLERFKLELNFNDGKTQVIDFGPFFEAAKHPEIKKYQDLNLFKSFKIVDGDLDWNDFDLSFPIWDLYNNSILKGAKRGDEEAS